MKSPISASPLKISLFVAILLAVLLFADVLFLRYIELKTYDLRLIARGEKTVGPETVVVAIDEKSLKELGRWPWSRTVMARLVSALKEQGAGVIGFDVVFAEREEDKALAVMEGFSSLLKREGIADPRLRKLMEESTEALKADSVFSRAIGEAGKVILGYLFHFSPGEIAHVSPEEIAQARKSIRSGRYESVQYRHPPGAHTLYEALAPVANLPELSARAAASGFFNAFPDRDGTIRYSPLVIRFNDDYYSSLAVNLVAAYLNWPGTELALDSFGVSGIKIGDIQIPTDHAGRMLVNYLGGKSVPHVSACDVISGRLPRDFFKDRIVLVGATAIGIYDLRVTPFSPVSPGVNIHATVVDNILRGNFLIRSPATVVLDYLTIFVFSLFLGLVIPRFKALGGALITLGVLGLYVPINFLVFAHFNLWLNLVYPTGALVLSYLGITIYSFFIEEREKRKIRHAFQHYLTSSVVSEILKDPAKLKLGGEKKVLSVLFSDIRGFTTLAEALGPEELVTLLNEYLTAMTEVVFKYDGLLDKYIGDAIMAVFGAPVDQKDHPWRACKVALEMKERLKVLQGKWKEEGRPSLEIGVGISSGEMVVGNMGSQMRFDYTVMGDQVNLASRLEGINKLYGTGIIVSEFTRQAVRDRFLFRELDLVRVKGKTEPVRIYELRGERPGATPEELDFVGRFEEALVCYRGGRWEEARRHFDYTLKAAAGDNPSRLYLERLERMKDLPETPWDGVFNLDVK